MTPKNKDRWITRNLHQMKYQAMKNGYSEEEADQMVLNSIKTRVLWDMMGHKTFSELSYYDEEDFPDGHPDWMQPVVKNCKKRKEENNDG